MLTMVVSGIVIGISSAIGMRELIGLVGIVFYPIFWSILYAILFTFSIY